MNNTNSSRRDFILNAGKATVAAGLSFSVLPALANELTKGSGPEQFFVQQPLPYAYDALEPAVDAQTMNIHFTKHAAAYVKNLNEACMAIKLESSDGSDNSLIAILTEISKHSAKMRNNAGGHYNHTFFWNCMIPEKDKKVMGKQTAKLINEQFGNIQTLQDEFMQKAKSVFGNGRKKSITVTVVNGRGSASVFLSYDAFAGSSVSPMNAPSTGGVRLSVTGSGLGTALYSAALHVGRSAGQ